MSQPLRRPKLSLVPSKKDESNEPVPDETRSSEPDAVEAQQSTRAETDTPSVPPPVPSVMRGPLAELPDAELVALGVQGNRKALELLYRRHAPFAVNLATRIEGSARDADDIVHDAFIKAFDKLRELSDRSAFKSWLGSIVVRDVRSHMRRAKLMRTLGLVRGEPVDLDAVASSEASPNVRAQIAQVYALLRTLPVDDRIAWILRSVEGHDLQAVAQMTSCSLATAKRRIARVQNFLDEHFVDVHTEEGEP